MHNIAFSFGITHFWGADIIRGDTVFYNALCSLETRSLEAEPHRNLLRGLKYSTSPFYQSKINKLWFAEGFCLSRKKQQLGILLSKPA